MKFPEFPNFFLCTQWSLGPTGQDGDRGGLRPGSVQDPSASSSRSNDDQHDGKHACEQSFEIHCEQVNY